MKKVGRILLVAFAALLIGIVVFAVAFGALGWRLEALSSVVTEQRLYNETEGNPINSIYIDYDNTDIEVSLGTEFSVSYPEFYSRGGKSASEITLTDEDGSLRIIEKSIWRVGLNFTDPKLYITIPEGRSCNIELITDNGDILYRGDDVQSAGRITLDSDNGDIILTGTLNTAEEVKITTDNGDVEIGTVNAKKLTVDVDNGDINFRGGTITETVSLETSNGDVELKGSVSAKSFSAESDNGDIDMDEGRIDADSIVLHTSNGDVEARLVGRRDDFSIEVERGLGECNISNSQGGARTLSVETSLGDIDIRFIEN